MDPHEVLELFDGFYDIGWAPVLEKPSYVGGGKGTGEVKVNTEEGRGLIWILEEELGVDHSPYLDPEPKANSEPEVTFVDQDEDEDQDEESDQG